MAKSENLERLHQALRAWADGDLGCMAAVEMLIKEQWWLRRLWQMDLIDYTDDPDLVGPDGPPLAGIDWLKVSKKRWPQSGGELALLMTACSIGSSQVKVSLCDVFTSMDSHNSGLAIDGIKAIKEL
ncbi:hypothetical protein [Streptomyces sp. NPDC088727]|uniref:hypothetical protein n=1 Tax=Streptomyces sp. NPDC088727 TaxID=3365875 RepID=UPI0038189E4E